jgi:hypothetical protein
MRIFIDDSGSFSWHSPGRSLFCGVIMATRAEQRAYERFRLWRKSIIGNSRKEIKGAELTERQLSSFVTRVLPWDEEYIWLSVAAIDTRRTRKDIVEQLRVQASAILLRCSELCEEHGNPALREQYRQMAGWIGKRSSENMAWMIGLVESVVDSLQVSIVRFMEPEDDEEFETIKIAIDESFIRRSEHISFWREWLRSDLAKSSRKEPSILPDTWRKRDHPFIRSFSIQKGLLDLRPLFINDTGFFRSTTSEGLQIADICANIIYRHHRGTGGSSAYSYIQRRIVVKGGAEIHLIEVNEQSLHKDDPRNHVGIFDLDEYRRRADEMNSSDVASE